MSKQTRGKGRGTSTRSSTSRPSWADLYQQLEELRSSVARERASFDRMASLQEVTAALSEALTTDDVITAAVDRAVSALGARTGGLWLVDKKSKVAQLKHSAGDDRAALEGFAEIPLESSTPMPVTSVIRTGKAVWIESSVEFERNYPQLAATIQPRTRDYSLACLPMRVEARCIGALVFNFDVAQKFSEGERFFLLGIAWHSAQALERARLYEAAHTSSDWTARLLKVTSAFSRASTAKEVAVIAVSLGVEALQAHGGALWLIGAGADEAELIAEVRMDPAATERFRRISLNANIGPAEAIRTNAPIFLESLRDVTNLHLDLQDLSPLAGGSRVYLPISVVDRTLGALGCSLGTWRSFSPAERSFLIALTDQCAQAMERARLFESEHQAHRDAETNRRRASFLSEASALLSSSLEYDARLRSLVQLAVPRVADWCIVALVENHGSRPGVAIAHAEPAKRELAKRLTRRYQISPSQPLGAINVLSTGEPELYATVPDSLLTATAHDEEDANTLRSLGIRSAMIVPMRARDKTIGVITFAFAESGRHYTAADLETAKALAQRTALAVDNARLYEEAQNAIRVREDVLAIVSHDLGTPLTSIFTATSLLRRALETAERGRVLKYTEMIHRAASQMSALIRDLLDVVNIELGRFAINRQRHDLHGLVREAVEAHEALAKAKSIKLTATVEGDSPPLWCDRDRMLQIFSNLLGNAVKFTPEGGQISIQVKPDSNQVTFVVKDTGIGIPEEKRHLIFERYWKATQDDRRGVGIGLYIAKTIVEAHRGKIWVESRPTEGSSFVFVLPAKDEIPEGDRTVDPSENLGKRSDSQQPDFQRALERT